MKGLSGGYFGGGEGLETILTDGATTKEKGGGGRGDLRRRYQIRGRGEDAIREGITTLEGELYS